MSNRKFKNNETNASITVETKTMQFPFISNEGKIYEAFPMIRIHLVNGERIDLDYFGSKSLSYIPTRFMQRDENNIIPLVNYLTKFKSEKEVVQTFMEEIVADMRNYHKNIFSIGGNTFINWDNVCKIDVLMQQHVYCYEHPIFVGNSKHVRSEEPAIFISTINSFVHDDIIPVSNITSSNEDETEVEIDYGFLKCPELMND